MRQSTENEDRSKEAGCRMNDPPPLSSLAGPPQRGRRRGGISPQKPPRTPLFPHKAPCRKERGPRPTGDEPSSWAWGSRPAGRRKDGRCPAPGARRAGVVSELQLFHLQMQQFHLKVKHAPSAAARCYQ